MNTKISFLNFVPKLSVEISFTMNYQLGQTLTLIETLAAEFQCDVRDFNVFSRILAALAH